MYKFLPQMYDTSSQVHLPGVSCLALPQLAPLHTYVRLLSPLLRVCKYSVPVIGMAISHPNLCTNVLLLLC
jgi:hypothetical protein